MRKWFAIPVAASMLAAGSLSISVEGQTLFRNEFKNKYDLKTVSCFTCHERVERGVDNPKQYRNEFGKIFELEFEGENITARLDEVATLDREDPTRVAVETEIATRFLEVLEKVADMENPAGGTYRAAFENATLDGLTGD